MRRAKQAVVASTVGLTMQSNCFLRRWKSKVYCCPRACKHETGRTFITKLYVKRTMD
ncbi:Uncharacterised protein [Priestia megaterium]|nr:Uncharacterised protein [Priestia megaterium]